MVEYIGGRDAVAVQRATFLGKPGYAPALYTPSALAGGAPSLIFRDFNKRKGDDILNLAENWVHNQLLRDYGGEPVLPAPSYTDRIVFTGDGFSLRIGPDTTEYVDMIFWHGTGGTFSLRFDQTYPDRPSGKPAPGNTSRAYTGVKKENFFKIVNGLIMQCRSGGAYRKMFIDATASKQRIRGPTSGDPAKRLAEGQMLLALSQAAALAMWPKRDFQRIAFDPYYTGSTTYPAATLAVSSQNRDCMFVMTVLVTLFFPRHVGTSVTAMRIIIDKTEKAIKAGTEKKIV
jgi:hypothetical protein